VVALVVRREVDAVLHCRVEEEENEEQDRAGDMDEAVDSVCPVEKQGVLYEPPLNVKLVEDVQALLQMDDLKSMSAGNIDSAFDHCDSTKGTAQLVDLWTVSENSVEICEINGSLPSRLEPSTMPPPETGTFSATD
jgi:hypothetical protein